MRSDPLPHRRWGSTPEGGGGRSRSERNAAHATRRGRIFRAPRGPSDPPGYFPIRDGEDELTDAPCEVWFYHLERSGADDVLPELLRRTLERGWRALVKSGDAARLAALDAKLWTTGRPEAVLPHGLASEPHADRQPILLSTGDDNPNNANALFLLDGAEAGPLDGYARCLDLFDGRDPQAVQAARGRWKTAKAQGATVSYWRQSEGGRWEKQA